MFCLINKRCLPKDRLEDPEFKSTLLQAWECVQTSTCHTAVPKIKFMEKFKALES